LKLGECLETFFEILKNSGKSGVVLALHILLPIMVLMMSFMRVLEDKGVLRKIAMVLSPVFIFFGLPGLGIFAILQILFVSFAAPVSTLKIMDGNRTITKRHIAATLAAILTMSQANAAFPLMAVGLNFPLLLLSSLLGGLLAGFLTYRVFTKKLEPEKDTVKEEDELEEQPEEKKGIIKTILSGAEEGFQIVLKSIPLLVLAILIVNILKKAGAIGFLERILSPVVSKIGIPGVAILPIVTKYIAGGTAMMGVAMELRLEQALSAIELNRIAGLIVNPFDPVGIAVLSAAGTRVGVVVMPAIKGALIGILFRAVFHFIIF
jgi:spore maturation protein SpmB